MTFGEGGDEAWSLAAWQGVFFSGMACGWYWRTARVRAALSSRWLLLTAGLVGAIGFVTSHSIWLAPWSGLGYALIGKATSKSTMAPGRFMLSLAVLALLYLALTSLRDRTAYKAITPVISLGQRALDSYLILGACAIAAQAFVDQLTDDRRSMLLATCVIVACWLWAVLRAHWSGRREQRRLRQPRCSDRPLRLTLEAS